MEYIEPSKIKSNNDVVQISTTGIRVYPEKIEMVSHPNHYNQGKYEVIDVINDWKLNFNLGNAIKYIARHQYKGKPIEDLEKAKFYLEYELKRLKGETDE